MAAMWLAILPLAFGHPGTWDGKVIMNENGAQLPDLTGFWTEAQDEFQLQLFQVPTAPAAAPNSRHRRPEAPGTRRPWQPCGWRFCRWPSGIRAPGMGRSS
mmetsp:Transcript_9497/g.22472  ORF Transcript_9497/g.22472 Transcript_9497/m.22472 type:complete len:101 (-) Transcript_9497:116-418(-)